MSLFQNGKQANKIAVLYDLIKRCVASINRGDGDDSYYKYKIQDLLYSLLLNLDEIALKPCYRSR